MLVCLEKKEQFFKATTDNIIEQNKAETSMMKVKENRIRNWEKNYFFFMWTIRKFLGTLLGILLLIRSSCLTEV